MPLESYNETYTKIIHLPLKGVRILGCTTFYPVSLVTGMLDKYVESAYLEYLLNLDSEIYYIYDRKIANLPKEFQSKTASCYLGAIELLAEYATSKEKLHFVVDWLEKNRNENGKWDMSSIVNPGFSD